MAIAIDQASIGTLIQDSGSTSITLTTSATVASGGFIVIHAGGFGGGTTLSSVSGGGLTWTVDYSPASSDTGIASAQAPSGLAAGAEITATFGASVAARIIGGTSFTGVKASSPVDGSGSTGSAGGPSWTSGSYAILAGSVLIGAGWSFNSGSSHSPGSPALEAWESVSSGDDYGRSLVYRIESSAGSYTVGGTWGGGGGTAYHAAIAYQAAAGGTDATVALTGFRATGSASVVAPPRPRPAHPYSEINLRM